MDITAYRQSLKDLYELSDRELEVLELLVKGAKDLNHAGFESCQTYLKQLLDKDVGIYACPTWLKFAGFEPEDLMDGIQVAQKDKFFNFTKICL